ncbi:MAG: NADH-quinone oxidoreductase subunit J [Thermodesulfobacteriota bacterium]
METILFYILAVITLGSAFFVIFLRRPIHNVLFMILTMIGLAGLFVVLQAEFIAMVQLIVYAGAVMVLFLFVIMLLNLEAVNLPTDSRSYRWLGGLLIMVLAVELMIPIFRSFSGPELTAAQAAEKLSSPNNTTLIAGELFTTYLLPFEIASVLLLAAMIGAVILSRTKP